jgi:uncharacterized protein RhaS with RHS repeats
VNPLGNQIFNSYDAQQQLIKTIDPLSHATVFTYDDENHLNHYDPGT